MKAVRILFLIIWWIIKLPFVILKVFWKLLPADVKSDICSTRLHIGSRDN